MYKNPIENQEYQNRYTRIQAYLNEHNLAAVLAFSPPIEHKWGNTGHVSYLTGWSNHDRVVESLAVVPAVGPPALLLAGLPYMLAQISQVSPMQDLRLVQAVDPNSVAVQKQKGGGGPKDIPTEIRDIIAANGLGDKDIGIVGVNTMPVAFYEMLRTELGEKLRPIDDIVAKIRQIKSAAEVEAMRKAAALSDLGFETMVKISRPGMRGIEIVAEMEREVRRLGADHAKYWMASGPPPHWSDSQLDIKPHERVLGDGDLMSACSYVQFNGYWCHGQRTGTLGRPCPQLNDLYAKAVEAQDAGLEKFRTGTPIAEMARAIREKGNHLGMPLQGGRIGHGIGMDYSEMPVPLNESNDTPLEAGMTAVIHTIFCLPETGVMFVPLGDVCHVTDDGADFLMGFQRSPFVAGG